MKKLFSILFLAVLALGNVWAVDPDYTLTPATGSNNSYTGNCDVEIDGITWNVSGNAQQVPWRIGGKSLSNVDRAVYSKTAYSSAVSKIDLAVGAASSITVNSLKLVYSTNSDFSSSTEISGTFAVNSTISFAPASGDFPKDAYYKFVFNVSVSGTSNKFVEFKKVEFYNATSGDPDPEKPTLESIAVSGTPTKTTYNAGDAFDPAGLVVTGTYSEGDPQTITEGITWSEPAALVAGQTSVNITATVDGVTSPSYTVNGLTVNAHIVTPGTYEITPNNTFFNCDAFTSKPSGFTTAEGSQDDITIIYTAASNAYINATQCRMYSGTKLTLSVPTGYEITAIVFTADGTNWTGTHTCDKGSMTDNKNWTGSAQEVTITFGGTCRATKIAVTYAVPATLESVSVSGAPTKKEYTEGENFDPAGLTVTGNYSDESHRPLTEGITWSTPAALTTGQTSVSVTATVAGITSAAYEVTGLTVAAAKVLDHIALNTDDVTTEFWKGETFNYTNLVVTAYYDDETSTVVTPLSVSTPNMTLYNEAQTITVAYKEGSITKEATYEITVKTIANTAETAYTTAEAIAIIDANKDLTTEVYVKGTISSIGAKKDGDGYNSTYNSMTYWLDDDAFEVYSGKNLNNTNFAGNEDLAEGDEVIVYGVIKKYVSGTNTTYEFDKNNYIVSLNRPVVLQSIELNTDNVKKTYKIGTDDVFSAEGLVVTAHYNVSSNDKTIDLANVSFSGYDMTVANTYTVTVSYTENEVTKTATYQIQVKPNCANLATITMGATEHGTFDLSVKGEQCAETAISTVLTAEPAEHYHLASVTATNGTVGAIEDNTCTISEITADAEITAVFEEDAKGTATFVAGAAEATGTAPAAITKYVGQTLTIPANTFALAGHTFAGWKLNETTYQKGDEYTVAGDAEFVAQWEALPVWASTYTSNVDLASATGTSISKDKVKVNGEDTEYDALKCGTSKAAGNCTVKVPAGATALHFHAVTWSGSAATATLSIKNGTTELFGNVIRPNTGLTGSSAYTLAGDATQDYYCITFADALAEETSLVFNASVNRFALFGVNYVAPAIVTLDKASYDFEEVKENATATLDLTATKNTFATGDIVVTFEGADAAAFSAGAVDAETGKFTVTFAPTEVRAYSAIVKVSVDGAEATATLAGTGISATTPTISTDVETIDFGKVKQGAAVANKTVNVTLEYLAAANVAISSTVFSIDKTALTETGAITISANTAAMGTYSETLTISGEGAESKTVTVTMNVVSKYASTYTSNVTVGSDKVIIDEVEYEAIKKGTGSASQSTTITVPKGTQTLHFHAVAWNNENTVLVVKQGETTLASLNLYKDAGVKGNSPFTLAGDNYDIDQYFNVNVASYTTEGEAVITFTTTASPYRFVLYGVNQEGGLVTELTITEETNVTDINTSELTISDGATLNMNAVASIETITVENGGTIDAENTLTVTNLIINSEMGAGSSAQIINAENINITGDVYFDVTLGAGANPDQWHAFAVPFPVDAINGVYDTDGNKLANEVNYAIMDYHGDIRATGAYGWKKFRGVMQPGVFYLLTVDGANTTFRFKMSGNTLAASQSGINVNAYAASVSTDAGWNGIANPNLTYTAINADVQVLNPATYIFESKDANDVNFTVGTPFFYQAETTTILTLSNANGSNPYYAPARTQAAELKTNIYLAGSDYSDRLKVTVSEDATNSYEIGKDLARMTMTNTPKVPQIFGAAYGSKLAMVHTPIVNNEANIALQLYAPKAGTYTISAEEIEGATIYLMQDGVTIWNLSMSAYEADLNKGDNNGYSIAIRRAPQVVTGIEELNAENSADKFIHEGNLYILRDGKTYNAQGAVVK